MSDVIDIGMEGIFNGITSTEFGQAITTAVVAKFLELVIDAPTIEDKIAALERAVSSLESRVSAIERILEREGLRDYMDQILEGKSRAAPIRGTMRTLISLLRDGERFHSLVRPDDVNAALIDMENELNTLAEESIYTYTVRGTNATRFDPRFTLPSYIQGMNLYVSSLARWFPSRLGERRIRDVILFHADRLEHFIGVIKSQITVTAEVFTAEEQRRVPGAPGGVQYVELLVVRNAAMCKADGYLNRRVPSDWRERFEPRISGPFSVRVYNEYRTERWTEAERQKWTQFVQNQIPAVFALNECRRLALDSMRENAFAWRYAVAMATADHPLGLNVSWENGRGVVIRFHAGGFPTTQPARLYRYPDYLGEEGRSVPVNAGVEMVDPFPLHPGEGFRYELTVWGDELINNRFMLLCRDRFEFRHPLVVQVQDWRSREDILNGRPDMVDVPSAEQIGLRVVFNVVQDWNHQWGEVIAIEPPVGSWVATGSTITVTVNDG